MDQTSNITPSLRIQPLSPYQGGGQQQRPPFNQGQLLQGVISAKSGPNQFTIEIDGRQIQAESTAPLQIGQKLSLQVAALTPQVELHIVNSNAVNRLIGNSIHLIGQQAVTFPVLPDLAEISGQVPQLSIHSKETLRFYADSIAARSPVTARPPIQPPLTVQILNRAVEAFAAPQGSDIGTQYKEIGNLLQQLAQVASLPPATAARADSLASIFSQAASMEVSTGLPSRMDAAGLGSADDTINLLNQLGKLHRNNPQVQNLMDRLMPLFAENASLPATHPLQQLVALLAELDPGLAAPPPLQGRQLQEVVERLGINLEQLLANNSQEKAVQTLKHALLELAQQLPAGDKSSLQADQIVKSIELYHLLQVRLAGDSLFFMPLPFSFLDQGYLLIDADQSGSDSEKNSDRAEKTAQHFELHLQLEGLGNLQIDFREKDGGVTLKFLAADTERAKFLANFRGELDQWLTAANLESVQFLVGAQEPVRSLLGKIMGATTGMVDTNA